MTARYLETAEKANKAIRNAIRLVEDIVANQAQNASESDLVHVAKAFAEVYNLGIRSNPRPAQSTVRLRAVQKACEGFPLRVSMEEVDNGNGGTYKALSVEVRE